MCCKLNFLELRYIEKGKNDSKKSRSGFRIHLEVGLAFSFLWFQNQWATTRIQSAKTNVIRLVRIDKAIVWIIVYIAYPCTEDGVKSC